MRRHPLPFRIALAALACAALPAAAAPDPIEGKWWGMTGTDRERVDVGLELYRDASGALRLKLTQPISNYFAAEYPAEVRSEGNRISVEGLFLDLIRDGDTLAGTYPGPRSKATLKRVATLPAEPAIPDVPQGPEPLWQARLGGEVYASPVVVDGVAYVGGTGGVMNAIETKTGTTVWTYAAGAPIFGAAAASGDAIYFAADGGFLYKLDRATGKERWKYELGDRGVARVLPHPSVFDWDWQAAEPLVADGVVYLGARDGGFHAIDAASGARKWRFAAKGKITSGAAVDGPRVVFGSADRFVYALDRASGAELWKYDTRAPVDTTPVVDQGRVLVGNRGAGLYALASDSGKEIWKTFFWGSWVESTPVVRDGVVYVGSSDLRRVSAVDPSDGRVLWRSDVYGWTWGTPLVVGDRIYAGAAGGTPYFIRHAASFTTLDRKTGKILARRPLPDTGGHQWGIAGSPARSGDTVVVATIAGSLLAFPMR